MRVKEEPGLDCVAVSCCLSAPSVSEPGGLFGILHPTETLPLIIRTIAPSSDRNRDSFGRAPHASHGQLLGQR